MMNEWKKKFEKEEINDEKKKETKPIIFVQWCIKLNAKTKQKKNEEERKRNVHNRRNFNKKKIIVQN